MPILLSLALLVSVGEDPDKAASKPKKEKMICRKLDTTGTRMGPPPVCKTAAQWEADADESGKVPQFRERRNGM